MTREEIEKFSAVGPYHFQTDREEGWFEIGCIVGLETADTEPNLASLWHDASEEPQDKDKRILTYSKLFDYFSMDFPNYLMVKYGGQFKDWETVVLRNKISKWAYLKDLKPKTE